MALESPGHDVPPFPLLACAVFSGAQLASARRRAATSADVGERVISAVAVKKVQGDMVPQGHAENLLHGVDRTGLSLTVAGRHGITKPVATVNASGTGKIAARADDDLSGPALLESVENISRAVGDEVVLLPALVKLAQVSRPPDGFATRP